MSCGYFIGKESLLQIMREGWEDLQLTSDLVVGGQKVNLNFLIEVNSEYLKKIRKIRRLVHS